MNQGEFLDMNNVIFGIEKKKKIAKSLGSRPARPRDQETRRYEI